MLSHLIRGTGFYWTILLIHFVCNMYCTVIKELFRLHIENLVTYCTYEKVLHVLYYLISGEKLSIFLE